MPNIAALFATQTSNPINTSPWDVLKFPLSTIDQMDHLEELLQNNSVFRNEFIQKFLNVDYNANTRSSYTFAYALADALFELGLVAKFSWAGKSAVQKNKKLAFNHYRQIVETIFEILSLHDKVKFNKKFSFHFLKEQLLKNAKGRYDKSQQQRFVKLIFYY